MLSRKKTSHSISVFDSFFQLSAALIYIRKLTPPSIFVLMILLIQNITNCLKILQSFRVISYVTPQKVEEESE